MKRQEPAIACSVASSNQESKKPSMASQNGAGPTRRSATTDETAQTEASPAPEDFEFCVLSSGGLALAGELDAADMCAADEVFSGGKLLPLRLSTANSGDASALLLLRSDSLDGATTAASTSGFSSRSNSRSASSSSSSCVSRSTSSKSESSDPASLGNLSNKSASSFKVIKPPLRSLSSSVFYAHPSPSPRLPRRSAASASRRSTRSAPPAAWGVIRLGVLGAPEVYPRRAPADTKKVAVARGGSRSAKFEQASAGTKEVLPVDKKLGLGLLGAGLVCSCSPDAVAAVGTAEAAAAEARRRRKKAEDKKRAVKQIGQSTSRRSRILDWLEELSMPKAKNVV